MIKVMTYRFRAFERAFARAPGPSEPLFFALQDGHPSAASEGDVRQQLAEAANETHVSLPQILAFLGLDESARNGPGNT